MFSTKEPKFLILIEICNPRAALREHVDDIKQ